MRSIMIVFLFIFSLYSTQSMSQISDSLSYSLGVLIAKNLQQQGFANLNTTDLAKAIDDVYGGSADVDHNRANKIVQADAEKRAQEKYGSVKVDGEAFLAENGKRSEVTTLPSGLQYEIMAAGEGVKPGASDQVTTHYHGMLIDGTVFDSSVERGSPATFPVNGVIKGWQEILQMMPTGSKYKVFIPYNLAYGERGAGQDIPPFAALVFEIELLSIN